MTLITINRSGTHTPAAGDSLGLWLDDVGLPENEGAPALAGEVRADVCIVGGGYTGLWTALHLKQQSPGLDVVLVEADRCGAGPSGRNGGFAMTWWVKYHTLRKICGDRNAIWLAEQSEQAVDEILAFCERRGIDAQARKDGWLWTATSAAQHDSWAATVDALAEHDRHPFAAVPREQLLAETGSNRHLTGVFERGVATIHPGRLARGLRRAALEDGVRIFERSPVREVDGRGPLRVRADDGAVTADTVVLAINAWTAQIPEFSRSFAVIATDMIANAPIPERLAEAGPTSGVAISDSRAQIYYYRTTADGRIAFGKGGMGLAYGARIGERFHGRTPRADEVERGFRWLYPDLADVEIATSWTGPIDRCASGVPFFTRVKGRSDLLCGAGYSGNGVAPSYLGGRILASLALERAGEWIESGIVHDPPGRFPPEPVRYVGGQVVRRAISAREKAEDQGRRPSALTRTLADLAPPGPSETRQSRFFRLDPKPSARSPG